jgi:hypothetical protein
MSIACQAAYLLADESWWKMVRRVPRHASSLKFGWRIAGLDESDLERWVRGSEAAKERKLLVPSPPACEGQRSQRRAAGPEAGGREIGGRMTRREVAVEEVSVQREGGQKRSRQLGLHLRQSRLALDGGDGCVPPFVFFSMYLLAKAWFRHRIELKAL